MLHQPPLACEKCKSIRLTWDLHLSLLAHTVIGMPGRYLEKVDAAVKLAQEATGGGPVTLLAHSAGGWLGRVYLLVRAFCNPLPSSVRAQQVPVL